MTKSNSSCLWQIKEPAIPYGDFQRLKVATVQTQHYTNKTKDNPNAIGRPIPWINLCGKWLEQAGFTCGSRYQIDVYKNTLVLTIEENS